MPSQNPKQWTYALPAAMLLMAPFNILASLAMDIYLPVVPAMPGILGTTPAVVQLTLTLYMIMLGVGQILFGPLSDRIGRRPVLIGGGLLFTAASFLLAGTTSVSLFLGLRLLQAVGASAALVALFATVRDVYAHRPESAAVYSLMNAMLAFVPALGPILGALIAQHLGWQGIFIALAVPALLALLHAWPRWHETRPAGTTMRQGSFLPVLGSFAFWTYTFGFSAAMGSFFVFFSTAPRVLIDRAGYSEMDFSFSFATAAVVMIVTTRFAKGLVARWGVAGSVARGMLLLVVGAGVLILGQIFLRPSFWSFVVPMWIIAAGIVIASSATANGALEAFGDIAGTAVALYFCIQSLIVGIGGTLFVILLDGTTAWPLAGFSTATALITLLCLQHLSRRRAKCPALEETGSR